MSINLLGNNYTATFTSSGSDPNAPYTNVGGGFAAATLTLDAASASVVATEAANAIQETSETITLDLTGPGTIALDGADTYSGGTNLFAGTLETADSNALGTGAVIFAGAATLAATANVSIANAVTINAGFSATFAAATGDTLTLDDVQFDGGFGTTAHFGSAANTGDVVLTTADGGGVGDLTGAAAVDGGTLTLGDALAAVLIANLEGGLTVGTGAASATLDLSGQSAEAWNLSGNASGVITNNGAAPATLTAENPEVTVFAGVIEDGTGTIALDVAGPDLLILTGFNTYSGGTYVQQGAVSVQGDNALGQTTVADV
ncbi:MAG: autotransporter-associated beta strand repeat-containing protein, partial [Acidimicrobiia bacterium]|nr:autotransporter-associated beta strand repeat-containing protein [Acidimicrobiia bacterium]